MVNIDNTYTFKNDTFKYSRNIQYIFIVAWSIEFASIFVYFRGATPSKVTCVFGDWRVSRDPVVFEQGENVVDLFGYIQDDFDFLVSNSYDTFR